MPVIFTLASTFGRTGRVRHPFNLMLQLVDREEVVPPLNSKCMEGGCSFDMCLVEVCPVNFRFQHVLEFVMF